MLSWLRPKQAFTGLCLIAGLHAFSPAVEANGLQGEMDNLFDEMSNYTAPGAFETQRRGVLSGGRYTMKTRIFDENLISLAPPSWKGGCGGVDLFGGSLSFINSDQIVQLLRSVAANAKGYAFQLALDNVCPDCAMHIENFQKKVQSLNENLSNSCQLAQGIVNNVADLSPFNVKYKTEASLKGTLTGLYDDFFSSKQETDGETPISSLKTNKPKEYEKLIGNVVWKQLKRNGVNNWFAHGDTILLESIMSLTGSIIVSDIVDDTESGASGDTAKTNDIRTLPGNKITLSNLVFGGKDIEIYSCDGDTEHCLNAGKPGGTKKITLIGIRDRISDMLLGTGSNPGLVFKYASNASGPSTAERAFVASLPDGVGSVIRNLAVLSKDTADMFVRKASTAIAIAMMKNTVDEFFRAARQSLTTSKSTFAPQALAELLESRRRVDAEFVSLTSMYGDMDSMLESYATYIKNTRKSRYVLSSLTPPSTAKSH